jgi:hypothetical protein
MEKQIKFTAKGFVLGNYWGGGQGAYPTTRFTANTKEELLEQANKALKDGSIDSGMGYESLVGAILEIKCITKVEIDGQDFFNHEIEEEFIGKLNDDQADFLTECMFGS